MGSLHGITSLAVFTLALVVGLMGIAHSAPTAAALYAMLLGAAALTVCGTYCAKCPCRKKACGHLLPGLIARILPARRQTPYSTFDLVLTAAALAAMVLFPQPWLTRLPVLLVLFWLLVIAAAAEILGRVCPRCRNPHCPVKTVKRRSGHGKQIGP